MVNIIIFLNCCNLQTGKIECNHSAMVTSAALVVDVGSFALEIGRCGIKNHYTQWRLLRWKFVTGVEDCYRC